MKKTISAFLLLCLAAGVSAQNDKKNKQGITQEQANEFAKQLVTPVMQATTLAAKKAVNYAAGEAPKASQAAEWALWKMMGNLKTGEKDALNLQDIETYLRLKMRCNQEELVFKGINAFRYRLYPGEEDFKKAAEEAAPQLVKYAVSVKKKDRLLSGKSKVHAEGLLNTARKKMVSRLPYSPDNVQQDPPPPGEAENVYFQKSAEEKRPPTWGK